MLSLTMRKTINTVKTAIISLTIILYSNQLFAGIFPYYLGKQSMIQFFLEIINTRLEKGQTAPTPTPNSARAVSFNVHEFRSLNRGDPDRNRTYILESLRSYEADIITLQEARLDPESMSDISDKFPDWTVLSCQTEIHGGYPTGNVLITRFPILESIELNLPGYSDRRCAVIADVSIGENRTATIIATHFDNLVGDMQKEELAIILNEIGSRETVLFMGDFNAILSTDPALETLKRVDANRYIETLFIDEISLHQAGFSDTSTITQTPPPEWTSCYGRRVDYIFLKNTIGTLRPLDAGAIPCILSDHLPIYFDFDCP